MVALGVRLLVAAALSGALYISLVEVMTVEERYALMAAAAIGGGVFGWSDRRDRRPAFAVRWIGVFAARLITGVIVDTGAVFLALVRPLRRDTSAGRFIELPIDLAGDESETRAIAVLYGSSLTPNAIPIYVDHRRKTLVLHQLYPKREPGAGDQRWPV